MILRKHLASRNGFEILGIVFTTAIVGAVVMALIAAVGFAYYTLKLRRQHIQRMYIRQWSQTHIDCPLTLGWIGPFCIPGAEVVGRGVQDVSGAGNYFPRDNILLGPAYLQMEDHEVRLVCEDGPHPTRLRLQARPVGSLRWIELFDEPYLTCEYGPGVRDYMLTRMPWP